MNRIHMIAACALLDLAMSGSWASGSMISTPLVGYEDSNRAPTTVPFLISAAPQNRLFAFFSVPEAQQIQSLNSVRVVVTAGDDGDSRGETAEVNLNVIGDRILLGTIVDPSDNPTDFLFDLDASLFEEVLARMRLNNLIPVQIQRGDGDMVIYGIRLEVDAELVAVPEPSAASLAGIAGLGLVVCEWRRRRG